MIGRYVRLVQGSMIVQRQDVRGVIAHLHDLARHLEALIPDDAHMENLSRSRDFSGGFAQRAEYERELERTVLEVLATRPANAPYAPLNIEGYSSEQIDSAVYRLWRKGYVDAHDTKPARVHPSALTTKGFQELEKRSETLATKGKA